MIISALTIFVETTLWHYLASKFLEIKYSKEAQIILSILALGFLFLADVYNIDIVNMIVYIMYICFYSFLLTKSSFWKKVTVIVTFILINIFSEVFVALILSQIFSISSLEISNNIAINQIGRLCSKMLMIVLTYMILQSNLGSKENDNRTVRKIAYLLIIFPLASFLLLIGIVDLQIMNDISGHFIIAGVIGMIISSLLVYYLFERTLKLERIRNELLLLSEKKKIDYNYYKSLEINYENIRFLKHDFISHMSIINQFVLNRQLQELELYLSQFKLTYNQGLGWKTNLLTLDVVLNERSNLIIANCIKVEVEAEEIDLEKISLVDQSIVLSNLLDNAIKGCLSMPASDRYIKIRVRRSQPSNKIVLKISNSSAAPRIMGSNESLRKETIFDKRGYGLKIVRRICDKNDADFRIKYTMQHSIFEAVVIIR